MIVLVAQADDTFAQCLAHKLMQQGCAVRVFDWSDIMYRQGLSWWVPPQPDELKSHFLNGKDVVPFGEIEGMLVLPSGVLRFPSEQEWEAADRDYIYREVSAAILGILHGLPCPVINLPVPGGRPRLFFTSKRSREFLTKCHFRLPPMIVMTSVQGDGVRWKAGHGRIRVGSLNDVKRERVEFLENGQGRWDEAKIPCPVFLQEVPSGEIYHFVLVGQSVLGGKVVPGNFDGSFNTKVEMSDCSPDLRRACLDLSRLFRLTFTECLIAETSDGLWYCLDWNEFPQSSHWTSTFQKSVVSTLVDLLREAPVLP